MSNHSLPAQGTDLPLSHKSVVSITHEQNISCSKTLICRQLFAGHVVSSRSIGHFEKYYNTLCLSPKFCISIVFIFFGDQKKLETMLMQNLEGQTKSIMVFSKVAHLKEGNNTLNNNNNNNINYCHQSHTQFSTLCVRH